MPNPDEEKRAPKPTRRSDPNLLASAVTAVGGLTDVLGKGEGQWSRELALNLLGDLFDLGDRKALNLAMKFIEHLKMDKRSAKRELVQLREVATFYGSIGMTTSDLAHGPDHPECDIGGFHHDMIRIRDNLSTSPPLGLFKMSQKGKTDPSLSSASLYSRFGISLQKRYMLSSGIVPCSEDEGRNAKAKLASHFLFRVSFKLGGESPSASSRNGMPTRDGADPADEQLIIKKEQGGKDKATTTLAGLPRTVLELGHVVVFDMRKTNQSRMGAPQIPTGMGLFVDMEHEDKTLWLIRTTPYMSCPPTPIGLERGIRKHM